MTYFKFTGWDCPEYWLGAKGLAEYEDVEDEAKPGVPDGEGCCPIDKFLEKLVPLTAVTGRELEVCV